jgi:hypothetical protein
MKDSIRLSWNTQFIILFVAFVIFVTGCAALAPHELQGKAINIQVGQTREEVTAIMGSPQNRQFKGQDEAWQYCETSYTGAAGDDYLIIWFNQGLVTGTTTYKNHNHGFCESYFKTIQWEDAPDAKIEYRIR